MHRRYNAQRQHIIHGLDTLLFQLHTLSFFFSPSLLGFFTRVFSQFQCSKPREIDPSRSLRFWYIMLVFFNAGSIWAHATEGASEGRTVVLDFVGQAHKPSKLHLLLLDALILFLQLVLATIAYEASLISKSSSSSPADSIPLTSSTSIPGPSSPFPLPTPSTSIPSTPNLDGSPSKSPSPPDIIDPPYIIDLRFSHILDRLKNPTPTSIDPDSDSLLPLPNTSPWPVPASLRMLIRARAEVRRRAQAQANGGRNEGGNGNRTGGDTSRRVPGAMDAEDAG